MIIKFIVNYFALMFMLFFFAVACIVLMPLAIFIPMADKKTWIEFTTKWPWEPEEKPVVPWPGYDIY